MKTPHFIFLISINYYDFNQEKQYQIVFRYLEWLDDIGFPDKFAEEQRVGGFRLLQC